MMDLASAVAPGHSVNVVDPNSIWTEMPSELDASVNFTVPGKSVGMLEARYVERASHKFAVYISSQTGCNQGCRMCHLTATKQTKLEHATPSDMIAQSSVVFNWYDSYGYSTTGKTARKVHFAFMARGEPLDNPYFLTEADTTLEMLGQHAQSRNLDPRYLVSTTLPKALGNKSLNDIFTRTDPEIYYSLYSMNEDFRRLWLPKAKPAQEGLRILKDWQTHSGKKPKIHYCFIKGKNDSERDIYQICEAINRQSLQVNVNLIRYNPYSDRYGEDTTDDIFIRNARLFRELMPDSDVKIVVPVGYDVNVSCGMFCGKPQAAN